MSWTNGGWTHLRRVFRLPATSRRLRDELDAELRFHLDGRVEDIMEREGLSRAEAEREAKRRFGDFDDYRRQARSIDDMMLQRRRRMDFFDTIRRETRHAFHTLARSPSFSLIVLVTLALGLGAATTIFTLLDRVVLRPLPYPNADRMVHIGTLWPKVKKGEEYAISKGQFFYFLKNSTSLANLGLYDGDILPIPGDVAHPAERITMLLASRSLFDVLGIHPEQGRLFTAEEAIPQDPRVALITHGYWQRRFGGDPKIVGKRLMIGDSASLEIIGVLPATAQVPDFKADLWVPNHLNPTDPPQNNHTHRAIGVLKPGVSVEAAGADLQRVQDRMIQEYPNVYGHGFIERVGFSMHVNSMRDQVVGATIVRGLWIIFGAVAFVLLIAAANVANLFLVRIDARRREVAVRTALGAGRSHLAVHYLTESVLLSAVAGVCAIGLGYGLLHVVLAVAPQSLPRLDEVTFDWRSIAFCVTAAVAFGVAFGVLPLASTNLDIAMLREGGRGLTTSRRRDLARRALVITQVALAVVLLSGATLMVESFSRLRNVRPGFDPSGVETMSLALPYTRYQGYAQIESFWRELSRRVEALPGVTHAGATDALPLDGSAGCTVVGTDGGRNTTEQSQCLPNIAVSPGYFEAMGIKIAGRTPTWSDVEGREAPIIVSKAFANRFWPGENVIGHRIKPFNSTKFPMFPVVGVAEDVRANGLQAPAIEAVYFPLVPAAGSPGWNLPHGMTFVVRAPQADSRTLIPAIRQIVAQIDAQVPITEIQPMEIVVAKSMAQTSFTMLLLLISAGIALTLSAVGIYGVISYIVAQRRPEIGIRIALGAPIGQVARMVVGQSVTLAAVGVVAGMAAAVVAMRLLQSLLFEVKASDPFALGGTAVMLVIVAIAASFGPARRAAGIDPVEAMRA